MIFARARALMYLGRLTEAWKLVQEAERVAEESRELEVFTWVQVARAEVAYASGDSESTLEHGRRSLEIAEKLDNESSRMLAYAVLGFAYLVEGQPAAARDALRESAAIVRDRRTQAAMLPEVLALLAEAHLALGEPTEAVATAREGIELGRTGGCHYHEAQAQLALAAALLATDGVVPRAEIESALARAEQLVESIDGRSLSPRILELRGRLAAALGDAPARTCAAAGAGALPSHRCHRTCRAAGEGDRRGTARMRLREPDRAKFCLDCGTAFAARCADLRDGAATSREVLSRVRRGAAGGRSQGLRSQALTPTT